MKLPKFLSQTRIQIRKDAETDFSQVFAFDADVHPMFRKIRHAQHPDRVSMQDIAVFAERIDVPRAHLLALFRQESGSKSFTQHPDGHWYPIARLELHKLGQFTDYMFCDERPDLFKRVFNIKDSNASQPEQYRRMVEAITIIEGFFGASPVWMAAGWGFGQVQGFNHRHAGCGTVERFVEKIGKSEDDQLDAVCIFLENTGIRKHLASGDWIAFAKHYNGSARAEKYAQEIEQHYRVITGRAFS